jgi:hypothetical protein
MLRIRGRGCAPFHRGPEPAFAPRRGNGPPITAPFRVESGNGAGAEARCGTARRAPLGIGSRRRDRPHGLRIRVCQVKLHAGLPGRQRAERNGVHGPHRAENRRVRSATCGAPPFLSSGRAATALRTDPRFARTRTHQPPGALCAAESWALENAESCGGFGSNNR